MQFLIGFVMVFASVFIGYTWHHGKVEVLWQPHEFLIIVGASIGSFIIANTSTVLKGTVKNLGKLLKGSPYKKSDYVELLMMLSVIFKLMKSKGMLEIEKHIENPQESELFNKYPTFMSNQHATIFLCDYLRLMTMGSEDFYQMEDMMNADLGVQHHETDEIAMALNLMADGMPALGIVAAVLGVIVTMGIVDQPPKILGAAIAGALVGTFLGVLLSYGLVAPMSRRLAGYFAARHKYVECIKVALLAHLKGNAPAVSIEIARNSLESHVRPTFKELEDTMAAAPAAPAPAAAA